MELLSGVNFSEILSREIGMGVALILSVWLFLTASAKKDEEHQENIKVLITDSQNRIKDIVELSEHRSREQRESHERIVILISENFTNNMRESNLNNASNIKDLMQAYEKLSTLVSSRLDEVRQVSQTTQTIVAQLKVLETQIIKESLNG